MTDIEKSELEKCKNDIKYFIENYCTICVENIKLNDTQKYVLNLITNMNKKS